MAYVYRHIRLDKNQPFYIGIGDDNTYERAYSKHNRNNYWNNIVSKYGYRVDILIDDIEYDFAIDKEIEFISMYGRVDIKTGILCNLTNGGEGHKGIVRSKETLLKFSNAKLGNKNAKSKLVINIETGIIYDSLKEAAISMSLSFHSLYKKIIGTNKNNTPFRYL